MLLKPNMKWTANQGIIHPMVTADFSWTPRIITVKFTVEEPVDCYRAAVQEDNGRSWEDSCVEIFLQNPANPAEYFNFETTSRGFILAARGTGRENRQTLPLDAIAKIKRSGTAPSIQGLKHLKLHSVETSTNAPTKLTRPITSAHFP